MLNETVRSTINPENHGAELAFGGDIAPFALDKDLWPPVGDQKPEANDSLNLSADQIHCKTPTAQKENALEFDQMEDDEANPFGNASFEHAIIESDKYSNSEFSEDLDEKYVDAPDRVLEGLQNAKIDL
jgi:hypothetical protein